MYSTLLQNVLLCLEHRLSRGHKKIPLVEPQDVDRVVCTLVAYSGLVDRTKPARIQIQVDELKWIIMPRIEEQRSSFFRRKNGRSAATADVDDSSVAPVHLKSG